MEAAVVTIAETTPLAEEVAVLMEEVVTPLVVVAEEVILQEVAEAIPEVEVVTDNPENLNQNSI